jgi:hypothetical protein
MAVIVTECDLKRDRALIIETVARYLAPQSDEGRFEWLYLRNPAGPARAWLARDEATATVIGMAAAFPRDLQVGESVEKAWVLGDFCIAEHARSLGPAVKLQRACLDIVESGTGSLCYDFPSRQMMAVFRRLGIGLFKELVRWAKPLRVDRKIRERLGDSVVTSGVSAAGNLALWVFDRIRRSRAAVDVIPLAGACDDEFAKLQPGGMGPAMIHLARSPEYLNWRFLDNPMNSMELLTMRRFGRLIGYAACFQTGPDAVIADLFGEGDAAALRKLVNSVVEEFRKRGAMAISAHVVEGHPLIPVLKASGFLPRERIPFVVHTSRKRPDLDRAIHAHQWLIMSGDRDT